MLNRGTGGSNTSLSAAQAAYAAALAQIEHHLVRAQDTQDRVADQSADVYDVIGKALIHVPVINNLTNQAVSPSAPTLQGTSQVLSQKRHECQVSVKFTNFFIEMPCFTFGWQLDHTTILPAIPGAYPTGSAFVSSYQTSYEYFTASGTSLLSGDAHGAFGLPRAPYPVYLAAKLGAVLDALPGTNIWLHYKFTGRAQANSNGVPAGSLQALVQAQQNDINQLQAAND